jgi:hypothetical protein
MRKGFSDGCQCISGWWVLWLSRARTAPARMEAIRSTLPPQAGEPPPRPRGDGPPPGAGPWRTLVRLQKTLAFPLVFSGSTRHEKCPSAPAKWRDNALTKIELGRFWSRLFMQQCCPCLLFQTAGGASSPSEPFPSIADAQKRVPVESAPGGSRFRATLCLENSRKAPGHRPRPAPRVRRSGRG